MSNTNKYFSFPNSSINSFKESFNKFLTDMKDTSLHNDISNPLFKQKYSNNPFNWTLVKRTGDISVDTTVPNTKILFSNPSGLYQQVYQNLSTKLVPDTKYAISFEFECTAVMKFFVNGAGLLNLITNSVTSSITEEFTATGRTKGYFYFQTPSTVPSTVNFGFECAGVTNIVTIYSLQCQHGMVEFFDTISKEFLIDSTRYVNNMWKLTNDGINYKQIILDGDIEPLVIDGNLRDVTNNVYYKLSVNDKQIGLAPSVIDIDNELYLVDINFVNAYDAFILNHVNTTGSGDGTHKFVDSVTGIVYDIIGDELDNIMLSENNNVSDSSGAERFYLAFNTEHSDGGEHVFRNYINQYDRKIILTVDSFGSKTISTETNSKLPISKEIDHRTLGTMYFDSSNSMFHDEFGNHILKDQENRQWILGIASGNFTYTPKYSAVLTDEVFESFKTEHDILGRHIFRDTLNGFFYQLYVENAVIKYERVNYTPISTKDQILSAWNVEHDLDGNHVFLDRGNGNYYFLTNVGGVATLTLTTTPDRDFHHDDITAKFLVQHFHNTNIHQLNIHKLDDGGTPYTFLITNKTFVFEVIA